MTNFTATDAEQLRNNPIFEQAVLNVRENIVAQLEVLPANSPEAPRLRDELVISLQVLRSVENQIQGYIDDAVLGEQPSENIP